MTTQDLKLFEAFGIEMEYMLVDRDTLNVRPVADTVLAILAGGQLVSDFESGPITWSNELALHVLELKTTLPAKKIRSLPSQFEKAMVDLRPVLDRLNVRLLPTAMHPWMNPAIETILWPHENYEIYQAYDRIFDCKSHGWANVQSVHLNLPFDGDEEFSRLHAAVRLVLPILPALTASSPIVDGQYTGKMDTRMQYYADHCRAMGSLTGQVIPESIFDEATYRREVFEPIQRDVKVHDPSGVLQIDFLNARGAIARFDRGSVELRVMDVQEYPGADVAICAAVTAVVKWLVEENVSSLEAQQAIGTASLRAVLDDVSTDAENAVISDSAYLATLGVNRASCRGRELWSELLHRVRRDDSSLATLYAPLEVIENEGTLATRICKSLGDDFSQEDLHNVYDQLADCLDQWEPFQP
ncbi:Carboxylate-amine ligase YbdK [Rubripirellula amarantea]|uniref:Carboxylate-amine ligase YbdK n=1 Tax=Rubripirellula amarantea TaxID=2527999 RepID=A0A5C5WIF8_9BACT|nr:glutamate-cysteine ligase family protein [Rubripirellula amarantea]TWT49592.1 Carboxylate-amine ligase YbdK [Rubripirellula amarantea]